MTSLIREMKIEDAQNVSEVAVSSFMQAVSSQLSDEGVNTFLGISTPDSFLERISKDNLMFVSEDDDGINGVVELKEGRHIAMLFIKPNKQRNGIGRQLIEEALKYSRVGTVTVSASLVSVSAYEKYGFITVGAEEEKSGLRYQPMQIELGV